MRRRKLWGWLLAGALLAGCSGTSEGPAQTVETVTGLRTQKIELQSVPDEFEAPGSVIALSTAQVAARTMGTVLLVPVREGDVVRRGQLLAQLDARELAARSSAAQAASQAADAGETQSTKALTAAQAQADIAQKTYDRYVYLRDQKSVSPQEFDEVAARQQAAQAALEQAKAGVRQAEAGHAQAQSEVHAAESVAGYARVVAPFDGRVVRRTVDPGTLVAPGQPLFVIEDVSHYQLEVTLPSEVVGMVRKGSAARVQLDAQPDKSLSGKVAEIEGGANPMSHTVKARIDLPRDPGVQSGMFGRGFFAHGEKQSLVVTKEAILGRGQLRGLYLADANGMIHWRVITLGKAVGNAVEVLSGLNSGDTVVLNPDNRELDGKKTAAPPSASGEKHP